MDIGVDALATLIHVFLMIVMIRFYIKEDQNDN